MGRLVTEASNCHSKLVKEAALGGWQGMPWVGGRRYLGWVWPLVMCRACMHNSDKKGIGRV